MHSKVFELTYSEDDNIMSVEEEQLGEFDMRLLWRGRPIGKPLPPTVRLYVTGTKAKDTDYVPNTLSWPVCSRRFVALLLPLARNDIELLPAPLYDVNTQQPIAGYRLMNVVSLLECLDREQSVMAKRFDCAITPVFKAAEIPESTHIFRSAESPYGIMFSEKAVQQLRGKGLRGVAFITRRTT